jgi:hypothetical protein
MTRYLIIGETDRPNFARIQQTERNASRRPVQNDRRGRYPSSQGYEALAAKAQEADEDFVTARLVARARKRLLLAHRSFRKRSLTELRAAKTRCV